MAEVIYVTIGGIIYSLMGSWFVKNAILRFKESEYALFGFNMFVVFWQMLYMAKLVFDLQEELDDE